MDNALALRDMIINEERPMPALDISHVVDDKPIVNDRPLNSEQSAPAYGAYERLCRGEEVKVCDADVFNRLLNFGLMRNKMKQYFVVIISSHLTGRRWSVPSSITAP